MNMETAIETLARSIFFSFLIMIAVTILITSDRN